MDKSEYIYKPVAYAIETTPGITHVFSDPATLANMVDIYEECGYAVFPDIIAQEHNGVLSFLIRNLRIHASANELLPLEEFFYYREQNDVSVWSWHLVPGTGKNKGQFVWRFPKGQDMGLKGPVLSIHSTDNLNAFLFGSPDDMEHVWEMYRSLGKIPVRVDYTGEDIASMLIPLTDMYPLRKVAAESGQTEILNTLEYKELREMFADQSVNDTENSREDEFGGW